MTLALLPCSVMNGRCSSLGLALLVASSLGVACGGVSKGGSGNAGGDGGGAGTGSGGGSAGRKSCAYDGKTYADGATFTSTDGCNACSCGDGEVSCDDAACDDGCTYQGTHYREGQSFPAADGCNQCSCEKGGVITCTERGCVSCAEPPIAYAHAVEEARRCDPQSANQCQRRFDDGLACPCSVFINEANVEAIAAAKEAAATYDAGNCGGAKVCPPCATPVGGYCSNGQRCEPLWREGPQACKVEGLVYPHGATGVPDPTSCNKCTCSDGELSCTEINCPTPCPAEHVLSRQCALCGPADECLIVEHACLPTCTADTDSCACVDGVCRNLCG